MRSPSQLVTSRLAGVALALAAAAAATPAARAQDVGVFRFDVPGTPALAPPNDHPEWGQPDVGRLQGTLLSLNGVVVNTPLDVFCVDMLHYVTQDPFGWNVHLTNLGGASVDLSNTRQGPVVGDALFRYRKQAWLADQFAAVTTAADTTGIQAAMWLQFESSLAPWQYATQDEADAGYNWFTSAHLFSLSAAFDEYDWSRFTIITDVNAVGIGSAGWQGAQEFVTIEGGFTVTATPEPASLALLVTGAAALGVVVRRRRRVPRD